MCSLSDVELTCVSACIWSRFQTGPGRCTGGANTNPGDGLRLAQCQRHACCRRPGHMKTNTLHPALLLSSHPLLHLSHLPSPLSFLPPLSPFTPSPQCGEKEKCKGGKGGVDTVLPPRRPFTFSSPLVLLPPSLSLLLLAVLLRASICHCYI